MKETTSAHVQSRGNLKAVTPMILWLLLIAGMAGYHQYQVWIARTKLFFDENLKGLYARQSEAILDGSNAVVSGENIGLGKHTLEIRNPKAKTITTNFFVWFGSNGLGHFELTRLMGTLVVTTCPPALELEIKGPEWDLTLTNCTGIQRQVPTDTYSIRAKFRFTHDESVVEVAPDSTRMCRIAPALGFVRVTSSHDNTQFRVMDEDRRTMGEGGMPATIAELPVGEYNLLAERKGEQKTRSFTIAAGQTNDVAIGFHYGEVTIETKPAGATVRDNRGEDLGVTPLHITELREGSYRYDLNLAGYYPVRASLDVLPDIKTLFQTNLVNRSHAEALASARQNLDNGNYVRAMEAAQSALVIQPDDKTAQDILREARGTKNLRAAEALGRKEQYQSAIELVSQAVKDLGESEQTTKLAADWKQRIQELKKKDEEERLQRPKQMLDELNRNISSEVYFAMKGLRLRKSAGALGQSITNGFSSDEPRFTIKEFEQLSNGEGFTLSMDQFTENGYRFCTIAGYRINENETAVAFKVMEFYMRDKLGLGLDALVFPKSKEKASYIAIHSSLIQNMPAACKNQLDQGLPMVRDRLRKAAEN